LKTFIEAIMSIIFAIDFNEKLATYLWLTSITKKLTKHRALQCLIVNYLRFLVKEFRPNKKFSKLKRNYNLIFQFPNVSNVNKNENVCLIGIFFIILFQFYVLSTFAIELCKFSLFIQCTSIWYFFLRHFWV